MKSWAEAKAVFYRYLWISKTTWSLICTFIKLGYIYILKRTTSDGVWLIINCRGGIIEKAKFKMQLVGSRISLTLPKGCSFLGCFPWGKDMLQLHGQRLRPERRQRRLTDPNCLYYRYGDYSRTRTPYVQSGRSRRRSDRTNGITANVRASSDDVTEWSSSRHIREASEFFNPITLPKFSLNPLIPIRYTESGAYVQSRNSLLWL